MVTKARLLHDTVIIPSGSVATTQSASDNTTKVATTAYVTTAIANLADSAPSTLNTLNELAAALGDDANFSTTVTNSIATKLPLAGGTMTGALVVTGDANPALEISRGSANTTNVNLKYNTTLTGQLSAANGKFQISAAGSGTEMEFYVNGSKRLEIDTEGALIFTNAGVSFNSNNKIFAHTNNFQYILGGSNGLYLSDNGDLGNAIGIRNDNFIDFVTNGSEAMRIFSNGKVGIGENTTPLGTLHVKSTDSGATADGSADDLVVENNSNTGISILSGTASTGSIYFGDSDRNWDGYIAYSHGSSPSMTIASNGGGNYIKLDDTGHVGLSTTPTAWGSGYKSLQIGARGFVAAHSGSDLYLGQNAYHNSGWKYEAGVAASLTQHSGGQIGHYIAPVGSAGGAISWNAALFIDTNSTTTLTRTVNGSSSIDYANILKISRIGGATSNNRREAVISFFDNANSTYTAMISGVRTSPAGNYDGGLAFYTNSHSQNGNASSISEMVSGKALELYADQRAEFFGNVYLKDNLTSPYSGSGHLWSKIIPRVTPNYPSAGQAGTFQNWYQPARGESGRILYGNTNNAGGEYRCAGFIMYSAAEANNTPPAITIVVTESIRGDMVEFQVSNGWIQVKNTYGYGIELMGYVEQFVRA